MRNRFSDLINSGVARFEYTPLNPETPETDPLCREYNNVFGPALDTHMSVVGNVRVITGHNIADECKWNEFCNSNKWGGYDFTDSGNWTLNSFLSDNGLCYRIGSLNGDTVCYVEPCAHPEGHDYEYVANENLNESKSDEFYKILKKCLDSALNEGMKKKCSPSTVTEFEELFKQYIKNKF